MSEAFSDSNTVEQPAPAERATPDLKRMQELGVMHIVACGRHSNRYGEDDSVWDLSCVHCASRYEVAKKVAEILLSPPRAESQPPQEET